MSVNKDIREINENIKELNENITNTVKNHLPSQLQYIFGVYFLGLFFMMIYRLANYAIHCFVSFSDFSFVLLIRSLLVGIRFDTIVLCWILGAFLVLMVIGAVFKINLKWFYRPIHILICAIFLFSFFVIAVDVAYFSYFRSHINIIALSWIQSFSYIGSLILRHPIYLVYFSIFLISLVWYIWLMYCLYNATLLRIIAPNKQIRHLGKTLLYSFLLLGLCGWGMYGRTTSKEPLTIASAYFSDSDFFNQLAVSPLFNLHQSIKEEAYQNNIPLTVVDGMTTRSIVKDQFFSQNERPLSSPTLPPSTNIVMIMLENVSSEDISLRTTPQLYNISRSSLCFTNVYPDGQYDYNGVFSTLFGYPNILSSNSMTSAIIPKFDGIPAFLHFKKYKNLFFTTHKQKGNNAFRFLYRNNFDYIFSNPNLDTKQTITKISTLTTNFFACILVNRDSDDNLRNVDNKIKDFINRCKNTPWFSKTAFIFVGCNGEDKVPCMIYMPGSIKTERNNNLACQTDIPTTLLSMIDKDYNNDNSLGLNIFSGQRDYAISSYPSYAICQDSVWKYVWRDSGQESLYLKSDPDPKHNYIKMYNSQAEKMKEYLFAMLQYTQYNVSQIKLKRQ